MLALQNTPSSELKLPGLTLAAEDIVSHTAQFDLTLNLHETQEDGEQQHLEGELQYASDLFDAATITRSAVLEAIARGKAKRAGRSADGK